MPRKRGRRGSSDPQPAREPPSQVGEPRVEAERPAAADDVGWRSLLSGASAREVLVKIADGDPLELERRARAFLEARAVLVDVERLIARGLARVAYEAPRYTGFPPLDLWLARNLERSVGELLDEDRFAARNGRPADERTLASFAFLSEALGVAPELARKVAVVFNDLPEEVRRCYWAQGVQGRELDDCVAAGLGTHEEVQRNVERAVRAMSQLADPGPLRDDSGGEP